MSSEAVLSNQKKSEILPQAQSLLLSCFLFRSEWRVEVERTSSLVMWPLLQFDKNPSSGYLAQLFVFVSRAKERLG